MGSWLRIVVKRFWLSVGYSLKVAVDDYRELFRTEGERKKALRNISEAAAEMREGQKY